MYEIKYALTMWTMEMMIILEEEDNTHVSMGLKKGQGILMYL